MPKKKTINELIIDALATGKSLRLAHITEMVNKKSDRKIKEQDISSLVSKISNSDKCELGYLIKKEKTNKGYAYTLVKPALNLEPQQLYDLSHKAGKDRFSLDEAVKKYPSLKRYVNSSKSQGPTKSTAKQETKESPAPEPASQSTSDQELQNVLANFLKELIGQGGLKINVNLNLRLKGSGD